jgi:hypothetical protein
MNILRNTGIAGALLFATIAAAADPSASTAAARDPSVREAQAAKVAARRGGLTEADEAQLKQNRYARCDVHRGEDRDYCIRRMNGEGTVSGSVEGGGIYRELRVPVPAE